MLFLLAVIMGGRKSRIGRACSARRSSCCCPSCSTTSTMFRTSRLALAVVVAVVAVRGAGAQA